MHTGEIGFRVPKDRLPWSTLEGELQKQGYTILNWPQGVVREKDKGAYSLSAEEADKLYHALFVGERRLQFIPRDDGEHMSFFIVGLLSTVGTCRRGRFVAQRVALGQGPGESSVLYAAGKQATEVQSDDIGRIQSRACTQEAAHVVSVLPLPPIFFFFSLVDTQYILNTCQYIFPNSPFPM